MTARCEAQVRRHAEINPDEPGYTVMGPCGRAANAVVTVGTRRVPMCLTHLRPFLRGPLA